MKTNLVSILFFCSVSCTSLPAQSTSDVTVNKASIISVADCKSISRLDAFFIDSGIMFRIGVTSEFITKNFSYKVSLNDVETWGGREALCGHLTAILSSDEKRSFDFRYALIGYNKTGDEIFSVYIDNLSRAAKVNGVNALIDSRFKEWLVQVFPKP